MARLKTKIKKSIRNHRKILLIVAALLFIGGGLLARHLGPSNATGQSTAEKAAEKKDVDQNKSSLPAEKESQAGQTDNLSASSNGNINVIITYAAENEKSVQVSSYVAGIFEDGGTCTLTLTKGSMVVTRTNTSVADATHTTCPTFTIDNSSNSVLDPGSWQAVVSYKSVSHSGQSDSKTIEVQ